MKTYRVRFCWSMPVVAEYAVTVPDDYTPEQIVDAAHHEAEDDCWGNQEDAYNGAGDTFVDDIISDSANAPEIEVPEKWQEVEGTMYSLSKGHKANVSKESV